MVELFTDNVVKKVESVVLSLNGFIIKKLPIMEHLYLAESGSRKFIFTYRFKKESTLRRISGLYELGIDQPDFSQYCEVSQLYNNIDFYVFFIVENEEQPLWCDIDDVKLVGRKWKDELNFPNGIWFIPTNQLKTINRINEMTKLAPEPAKSAWW